MDHRLHFGSGWRLLGTVGLPNLEAMYASMAAIEYYLPERAISTSELSSQFPEWSVEKIDEKTGIRDRHVAGAEECASDLAVAASRKLFDSGACHPADIDYILLCTQSPDYFLPTTACLVQEQLGIPTTSGALDFNLGCSGFVYGLGLAEGLVATGQAQKVLLLTAETYSKFLHTRDRSATIFGDAAAATLLTAVDSAQPLLGPFIWNRRKRRIESDRPFRRNASPTYVGDGTSGRGSKRKRTQCRQSVHGRRRNF